MAFFETNSPIPKGNALAENVLKDKTFSNDNGVNLVGTMPDNTTRTSNGNVAGLNSNNPTIPLRDALSMSMEEGTDGVKRLCFLPPKGYYQGDNESFIGRSASELGNASTSDVLAGETFTSENGIEIVGAIPKANYADATYYGSTGFPSGYAYLKFSPKYLGNLDNNSWAPEVRLSKRYLPNWGVNYSRLMNLYEAISRQYQTGTNIINHEVSFTYADNTSSRIYMFVFLYVNSSNNDANNVTFSLEINGVSKNITIVLTQEKLKWGYVKVRVNSGDNYIAKIISPSSTNYSSKNSCILRFYNRNYTL